MTQPRVSFPDRFNLAHYLLEHNIEAGRDDKLALRWRDEEHTYGDVSIASGRLGRAFLDLGLRPEERVLIVLPDRPAWVHAWFATLKCGAVFTAVNTILTKEDYAYYLDYTRASVAVVDEELAPMFAELAKTRAHLRAVVVAGGQTSWSRPQLANGQYAMIDLIEGAPDEGGVYPTHRHDIAGWLFTSGSTGKPKGVVHFHEDFAFNIEMYAKGVLGITADDITASVPKLFFGYATGNNLMFPFAVGGSTVLFDERSTPEKMFEVIDTYRPTILTSVPTMIGRMLELDAEQGAEFENELGEAATSHPGAFDLSSLRLVTSAGEKLPEILHERWLERFGVEILDGIGSAELFHVHISNRPGATRPGSLGQAVPGYDCRVVDEAGNQVPTGDVGRLHVRGESAGLCYWQDHAKSKQTFAGDLVITGDMFRVDEDGYFFYEGRADELLKVGGVWVAPHEIEECLLEHELVEQAAVVGWQDGDSLVKPKAFVVLADGQGSADDLTSVLQEWVKQRLAPYKYPRFVEFLDDLPKNDRGKVDRRALKLRQSAPAT